MQTSWNFAPLTPMVSPIQRGSGRSNCSVFRSKIKILLQFPQDDWKEMRATKGSGQIWASRPISNGTDQSDRSIIMSRLTRNVIPLRHDLSIRIFLSRNSNNKFFSWIFNVFFKKKWKINGSTVLDIALAIHRITEKCQSKTATRTRIKQE